MGGTSVVSEEEYTVIAFIKDIMFKDRKIHDMGLAIPGNKKAFFYHEYPDSITGNGQIKVQVGDILKDPNDSNRTWRIEQILGHRKFCGYEIFIAGIVRKIDLNQ